MTGLKVHTPSCTKGPIKGAPEIRLALPAMILAALASCDQKV